MSRRATLGSRFAERPCFRSPGFRCAGKLENGFQGSEKLYEPLRDCLGGFCFLGGDFFACLSGGARLRKLDRGVARMRIFGVWGGFQAVFGQEIRRKALKNDGIVTTCALGSVYKPLIIGLLFFCCTIIGAIDGEGGVGGGMLWGRIREGSGLVLEAANCA